MFAFSFRGNGKAVIEAERVALRHPEMNDYMQWSALRAASASFLQPWEPRWPRDDLSRISFKNRLRRYASEISAGSGYPFFLIRHEDGALFGWDNFGPCATRRFAIGPDRLLVRGAICGTRLYD